MQHNLTPASLALFTSLVEDAPNWNSQPLLDLTPAEKGNLTQLKKAGLLTTCEERGGQNNPIFFALFTPAGVALAQALNLPDADILEAHAN